MIRDCERVKLEEEAMIREFERKWVVALLPSFALEWDLQSHYASQQEQGLTATNKR